MNNIVNKLVQVAVCISTALIFSAGYYTAYGIACKWTGSQCLNDFGGSTCHAAGGAYGTCEGNSAATCTCNAITACADPDCDDDGRPPDPFDPQPFCGDGNVDAGEDCDMGIGCLANEICDATCTCIIDNTDNSAEDLVQYQ